MKDMKYYFFSLIVSFLLCFQSGAFAANESVARGTNDKIRAEVRTAYYEWLKAVSTANGNPTPVLALYDPEAVLVATFAQKILIGTKQMVDYFKDFTSTPDLHGETNHLVTSIISDTVAVNSGLYTFNYRKKNNKIVPIPARFTFVYSKINGRWLIVAHHSSLVPSKDDE